MTNPNWIKASTADQYYTIIETAARLGISRFTVRDWYRSAPWEKPKLNAVKFGRQVMITRASVERRKREMEGE